jgi:c-di-GMP-binding flagellar brake protein YcgR
MKETTVNVSSTGMSFFSDQPHTVGDYLHVDLVVPTAPPQMMDLLAEVKWARHEEGQRRIGIGFCFRSMEERDSLARYVFRRHREMIRLQEKGA